jgi:hypothetical protein
MWVICPQCGQWNLVPLEERWEALEESEQIAQSAETRASGPSLGFARTRQGLELLQVGSLSSTDIANWRYGRRLQKRQSLSLSVLGALLLLGIVLGVRAGLGARSPGFGIYIAGFAVIWLGFVWYRPPRMWLRLPLSSGVGRVLWPWQLQDIHLHTAQNERPSVIVPRGGERITLRRAKAAAFLGSLLPKLNGADCATVSISDAVNRVTAAEDEARKRPRKRSRKNGHGKGERERNNDVLHLAPWEILAAQIAGTSLTRLDPERRVALEMAVTEECERADVVRIASDAGAEWEEEDEVAAIADDLLLPPDVTARLADEKARVQPQVTKKEPG